MKEYYVQTPDAYGNLHESSIWKGFFMRLVCTAIILTHVLLAGFATSGSAQAVSIDRIQVPLKTIFEDIRVQTGYSVIIPVDLLEKAKPISVQLKEAELATLIRQLTEKTGYTYALSDDYKIIRVNERPGSSGTVADADVARLMAENLILAYPEVRGRVVDSSGNSLVGATVVVMNAQRQLTNLQTTTDHNGYFILRNVPEDALLAITYIGYVQHLERAAPDIGTIKLKPYETGLEEVEINAGYWTVKDRERTGSIARVSGKEIGQQPVSNPLQAMQGRLAGVSITQHSGVPGSGFDIQIRGRNSLRDDGNAPLYIVDGIPFGTENLGNSLTSAGILRYGSSPLNTLNPADIASIEVLKDADATAIYGSRGANGVVLITTKKGTSTETTVSVNGYTGIGNITRRLKLMNTEQYLQMRREAFANDGRTEYPANAYDLNGAWDQTRYTDWQEELIGNTSVTNSFQASVSGGSENTRFLISGARFKEGTVFPGDFAYRKSAVNFNVNHKSRDQRFETTLSGNYLADKNDLPATDLTRKAYELPPNAPEPYDSEGNLNWANSTWENPLAVLADGYLAKNNNLIANGMLLFRPFSGWELKMGMGFTESALYETKATPHTIYDPAYGVGSESSALRVNEGKVRSWNIEPQLSFSKQLLGGTLQALVGGTFQNRSRRQSGIRASGFSNNHLIHNVAAATNVVISATNNSEYNYGAAFGRIHYAYQGRYFLNLTGRRDGSSRFGPGKQFANFGAIGAAWVFSEERTIKQGLSWLSYGKLRGSYGLTGSDQIGDYQFMDTYSLTGTPYAGVVGLEPSRLYNPDFRWETNQKLEGALELGFLNDRLLLTIAHYRNESSNQLVGIPLPGTTGFPLITGNLAATVQNTGWEFEAEVTPFRRNHFRWSMALNLTVPRNKLLAFPNLAGSTYASRYIVGHPLDIQRVYHYIGMNPNTGIYEFEDFDGDGRISGIGDREKIIRTSPEFYGGLQNTLQYRNWDLGIFFQFVKKAGRNFNSMIPRPGIMQNLPVDLAGAWRQPGDESNIQPYTSGLNAAAGNAQSWFSLSDGAYSDASFVRLKNLSISYSLPGQWSSNTSARIYAQGQNLFTVTKFTGPDPEGSITMLPPLRVLTLGVELSF